MIEANITTKQEGVLLLHPVDADGVFVKLDSDAIVVDADEETQGITTAVKQLESGDFEVVFRSGDTPTDGQVSFTVAGDVEPGAGITVLEENVSIRVTPVSAVNLGATFTTRPKS